MKFLPTLVVFFLTLFSIVEASAQTWNEVIKTVASDRAVGDRFGYSVAIDDNYAILGAFEEDEDAATPPGNTQNSAGSAYIFERDGLGNWSRQQKLIASDRAAEDYFGWSVSISGDYAIVGAWQEDEDAAATPGNAKSRAGFCLYL